MTSFIPVVYHYHIGRSSAPSSRKEEDTGTISAQGMQSGLPTYAERHIDVPYASNDVVITRKETVYVR